MATDAQIAANRRNARRSTGPRTPEGKARSSRNHLIHGLLAKGLIEGESPDELLAIHEDFRAQFDPQTLAENALVERAALAYFRLARFAHVEGQFLQREPAEAAVPAWTSCAQPYDRVTNSFRNHERSLHNLGLYEDRLERSFDRAIRTLRILQAQRLRQEPQETVPAKPPAAETVSAAPQPQPAPPRRPAHLAPRPCSAGQIGFEVSKSRVSSAALPETAYALIGVTTPRATATASPAESPNRTSCSGPYTA
jgi:hypothetical protein